ncbi:MAG: ATP-binding protein [Solirubrobacteraceae bacterium]
MDDVASPPPADPVPRGRIAPEVMAGLGALARVSRALVGTGSLAELATRALGEMRDALGLELAVLYLPDADGEPCLLRYVSSAAAGAQTVASEELRYDSEAWRLAIASGMPIVLREPAGWLGTNPFTPPAHDWLVLPLVSGRHHMVGAVIAAARAPVSLDPVGATVLALLGQQLNAGITTARLRQRLQRAEMERERRSLAADVHDGLAQDLALALREVAVLDEPGLDEPSAQASRARLREAVTAAHRIVRSRLEDLHVTVPLGGLRSAVEATAERFERDGPPVRVTVRGAAADLPPESVAVVSRVLGEALANVARHASADHAFVDVRVEGQRLELRVEDDGVGIDLDACADRADGHFGLSLMRERARTSGGTCQIGPRPGGGTRVVLRMPLR